VRREEHADVRRPQVVRHLLLGDETRGRAFEAKRERVPAEQTRLDGITVRAEQAREGDRRILGEDYRRDCKASELLRRPRLSYRDITGLSAVGAGDWRSGLGEEQCEQVELALEVQAKYSGYIERQQREIGRTSWR